jgi:hypothetical protein
VIKSLEEWPMRILRHVLIVAVGLLAMISLASFASPAVTPVHMPVPARFDGHIEPIPTPVAPSPQPPTPPVSASCPTQHRVSFSPTPPPPAGLGQDYYLDNWRLGPEVLPTQPPLGSLVSGWQRTGTMTPQDFLACYWNDAVNGWWYPDNDGFLLDTGGQPFKVPFEVQPGQRVDLFGTGTGHFLSPAGLPYTQRALPSSNLDTIDANFPFAYHLYEVLVPFQVEMGPIRPWFEQAGYGVQYKLTQRVSELVAAGYLRPLN